MTVIRHWIATEPRWKGSVTGRHVIFEVEVDDYRRQGWTVEGPYAPAEQLEGAVEALRPYLVHLPDCATRRAGTRADDVCSCGLTMVAREAV